MYCLETYRLTLGFILPKLRRNIRFDIRKKHKIFWIIIFEGCCFLEYDFIFYLLSLTIYLVCKLKPFTEQNTFSHRSTNYSVTYPITFQCRFHLGKITWKIIILHILVVKKTIYTQIYIFLYNFIYIDAQLYFFFCNVQIYCNASYWGTSNYRYW